MKYLNVFTDDCFGISPIAFINPRIRYGSRGIIFNDKGKIAILNKTQKNEYKLIGGGIEEGEDPVKAFIREALEECGCKIEVIDCLGIIREEKSQDNFIQESFVYLANVLKDTGKLTLTEKEIKEGSKLLWVTLDEAIELISSSEGRLIESEYESVYQSKFIVRRDLSILKYYKSHVKKRYL